MTPANEIGHPLPASDGAADIGHPLPASDGAAEIGHPFPTELEVMVREARADDLRIALELDERGNIAPTGDDRADALMYLRHSNARRLRIEQGEWFAEPEMGVPIHFLNRPFGSKKPCLSG